MSPRRRDLLQSLGALALGLAWERVFAAPAERPGLVEPYTAPEPPYSLGVASGAPRPEGMVLWTRLAPRPQEADGGMPDVPVLVQWEVSSDPGFSRIVRRGQAMTRPERAHCLHVRVDGLPPGQRWFYRFRTGPHTSPVGRSCTAPAPDDTPGRLRLAVASCQHYESGHYAAHRDLAAQDVDLVLFLGDYIYENHRRGVRQHESTHPPRDLAGYRRRYATYKSDPELQAAHAAHPWLMMWDDHEVENDYAGLHSADRLPLETFLALRTQAYQAYLEHQPVDPGTGRLPDAQGEVHLHGKWSWGQLADLWLLDERQWRSPQACDPGLGPAGARLWWGECAEFAAPARGMLGDRQERWFLQDHAASTAGWRLVGHGTPLSPQTWRWPALGPFTVTDGWDAYAGARERLLQGVAQAGGAPTVFLAGDVHRHMAATLRVRADDPRAAVAGHEFVTSSISSRSLRRLIVDAIRNSHPDCLYARGDQRGYVLIDLTPNRLRAEMRGTPDPVRDPEAPLSPLARFEIDVTERRLHSVDEWTQM